jgi:hypothetical protein
MYIQHIFCYILVLCKAVLYYGVILCQTLCASKVCMCQIICPHLLSIWQRITSACLTLRIAIRTHWNKYTPIIKSKWSRLCVNCFICPNVVHVIKELPITLLLEVHSRVSTLPFNYSSPLSNLSLSTLLKCAKTL